MKPTWQTQFQNNQQIRFSSTHLFILFLKIFSVHKFLYFQNKFADFKIYSFRSKFVHFNPIVLHIAIFIMNTTSEIGVRTLTGLKYFSHYSSWKPNKSIIKDRGVNLYRNESESLINLVAFPTDISFRCIYLSTTLK